MLKASLARSASSHSHSDTSYLAVGPLTWLRSAPDKERTGELTMNSEVGELARCQQRYATLQEAMSACKGKPRARCAGVTMDGGLPCNVILDRVSYAYPCVISSPRTFQWQRGDKLFAI
jgi:hypothetical protein